MTLAKAEVKAKAKVKHIYSTGIIYERHLRSSKYFYNTGPCSTNSLSFVDQNKHEQDCHSRAREQDGIGQNGMITEIIR
jgi:hypothetical protein